VAGQTLSGSSSITAGTVQVHATVAGQTLTASASLIPGGVSAGAVLAGALLIATASIVRGNATGNVASAIVRRLRAIGLRLGIGL
jgi:hypothetical protein